MVKWYPFVYQTTFPQNRYYLFSYVVLSSSMICSKWPDGWIATHGSCMRLSWLTLWQLAFMDLETSMRNWRAFRWSRAHVHDYGEHCWSTKLLLSHICISSMTPTCWYSIWVVFEEKQYWRFQVDPTVQKQRAVVLEHGIIIIIKFGLEELDKNMVAYVYLLHVLASHHIWPTQQLYWLPIAESILNIIMLAHWDSLLIGNGFIHCLKVGWCSVHQAASSHYLQARRIRWGAIRNNSRHIWRCWAHCLALCCWACMLCLGSWAHACRLTR